MRNKTTTEAQDLCQRLRNSNLAVKRSVVPDLFASAVSAGKPNPARSVRRFLDLSHRQFKKALRS